MEEYSSAPNPSAPASIEMLDRRQMFRRIATLVGGTVAVAALPSTATALGTTVTFGDFVGGASSNPGVFVNNSGSGAGVQGESANYDGVRGISIANNMSGVTGISSATIGAHGVYGQANAADCRGVHGESTSGIGVSGNGGTAGVFGQSSGGIGVSGNGGNTGVKGQSSGGIGVHGVSTSHVAVRAESTSSTGVYASSNTGIALIGTSASNSGVQGTSTESNGVQGYSTNKSGVNGYSTNADGIYGGSSKGSGVYAYTLATGAAGVTADGQGAFGILGRSQNGNYKAGVKGVHEGPNPGQGVFGEALAANKIGVFGRSKDGTGLQGESASGKGVLAKSTGTGVALRVEGRAQFTRSGLASIPKGSTRALVAVASGLSAASKILVTAQGSAGADVYVRYAKYYDASRFQIVLNKACTEAFKVAWWIMD